MTNETLTVTADSSVDSLTFTVTGVKDGANETLTIDGQVIPLVATTAPLGLFTDTNGKTFWITVSVNATGKATVTLDTPDGNNFTAAEAQAIVQGVEHTNNASPASADERAVAWDSFVEETGDGTPSTKTPADIGSTVTGVPIPMLTPHWHSIAPLRRPS